MLKIKKENCKSCGYCAASCKQGALSISDVLNQKGYNTISVDLDKCINCGIC
ncbi:MAG TPA: 4Fe-4S dicluster domain-containing protein, partial [Candidatus Pelethocola excrementipullorum]|nr:4Fe-4S dicluster domain-containing protein [Candidatus Pelethocola excrementipullorum]